MFVKIILSILAFGMMILGLLQFFSSGDYLIFVFSMAIYYIITISDLFFKRMHE
jgi:hypothetical protein